MQHNSAAAPGTTRLFVRRAIRSVLALALICGTFLVAAQKKKEELQKQKDDISQKIEQNKRLIDETESEQKTTLGQVNVLSDQIRLREQLLSGIGNELRGISGEIGEKESDMKRLQSELEAMKSEYAAMIRMAYRNRSSYNKLMYLFSADDFYQAYRRLKVMQRYAQVRKKHAGYIEETKDELKNTVTVLEASRNAKQSLADQQKTEKEKIASDKRQQQEKLTSLKKEEKRLREKVKKQEGERHDLESKIKKIIEEEIRKSAVTTTAKTGTGSTAKTSKTLELAPETKLANTGFESNKGALPWPVSAGVISEHFGRQPHPSIPGVEISSNGCDFTTEKNASILAVYAGKVTSVFSIPGAGETVIISHGTYRTVYANLASVVVKEGQEVSVKDKIGTVLFDGDDYVAHFEVWKVTAEGGAPMNPELWIKKR